MLAQLLPRAGGPPITLDRAITVIGRSAKLCDLVVDHSSVSKQHCMLVKTDGLVYLRDLGSTNGTRVNGQRVIRGALLPGDLLSLSGVSFKIHLGPDTGPAARVSLAGATELIPVINPDAAGLESTIANPVSDEGSKSDVRFLRDSEVLPPQ